MLAVPPPVTVRVPAKINLHLAVGPLREDGYHDLVTVAPRVEGGQLKLLTGPGWGTEVNEETVRAHPPR